MPTINFPSGIGAGIGQGIYAGVLGGLDRYDKQQSLARQSILDALKIQMLQDEIALARQKREAMAGLPGNIATIGQAVQRALQGVQPPSPVATPVDDLSTLAGVGGAAMRPPGMPEAGPDTQMIAPEDTRTPMQRSGLSLHPAALLSDPAVANASMGMMQAGVNPFGQGGMFASAQDFAKQIAKEQDEEDARKEYTEAITLMREAGTDTDAQISAIGKMNAALMRMGKTPDTAMTWKLLDAKQERDALTADTPLAIQAILGVEDGEVTAEDLSNVVRLFTNSKSGNIKQLLSPYFQKAMERMGPAGQAWKQYYEDRKAYPDATPDESLMRVSQTNPEGVQAMMQPDAKGRSMIPWDYQVWKEKELAKAKQRETTKTPTEASLAADAAGGDPKKALAILKGQREKPTDSRKAQLEIEILEARRDGAKALNEIRAKSGVKDETLTTATLALDRLQRAERSIREDYETPDEEKSAQLAQIKRITQGLLEEMDKIQKKKGFRQEESGRSADPMKNVQSKFGITLPGAK